MVGGEQGTHVGGPAIGTTSYDRVVFESTLEGGHNSVRTARIDNVLGEQPGSAAST